MSQPASHAPIDDSGRVTDPPAGGDYPYRRTGGPGVPITPETAHGGWVSSERSTGGLGVRFKGPDVDTPHSPLPWNASDSGRVVEAGLIPPVQPLLHLHMRDPIVCLGGDGFYYLTGTTGDNIWRSNDGIELWRSADLKAWDYLGLIWSIEADGAWEKSWRMRMGVPFRAVWAPELHYLNGNYYICHSISRAGIAVLKSTSGRPEGPYVHAFSPEAPLRNGIDATLFGDDDGAVYLTYGPATEMVRLKDDLSGYAGEWTPIVFETPDHDPSRHHRKCARTAFADLGFEGATLFKRQGRYYLGVVDRFENDRYSFAVAEADAPFGPYRGRRESIPCGGGGNVFEDRDGRWWCTFFGNDDEAPFREKPALVPALFDLDGHLAPDFTPRS